MGLRKTTKIFYSSQSVSQTWFKLGTSQRLVRCTPTWVNLVGFSSLTRPQFTDKLDNNKRLKQYNWGNKSTNRSAVCSYMEMSAPLYLQSLYGFWTHKWLYRADVFTATKIGLHWILIAFTAKTVGTLDFLGTFAKLWNATTSISFVMSVRPSVRLSAWNNSTPTGRIFIKLIFEYF